MRVHSVPTEPRVELYDSAMTVPSDSENYSANNEMSSSTSSTSSGPMILYQPPTIWGVLRCAAINLLLPFVNGMMLGFGELFAHEAAFRLGWTNTKIFPTYRRHPVGLGLELPFPRRRLTSSAGVKDTSALE